MVEEFLTVRETARLLKVRMETIRRYIKNGYVPANVLPGEDFRISQNNIKRFMEINTTNGGIDGK